jgi:hypothetical protein
MMPVALNEERWRNDLLHAIASRRRQVVPEAEVIRRCMRMLGTSLGDHGGTLVIPPWPPPAFHVIVGRK